TGMDWDGTGRDWDVLGMNWVILGYTGMDWEGLGWTGSGRGLTGFGVSGCGLRACGRVQVSTMPEYLGRRFGGARIRLYLALLSLGLYVSTKISVDMYSGALFIREALGWDLYGSVGALLGITALYTVTGLYWFVLGMALGAVGGYQGLLERYPLALPPNSSGPCGRPRPDAFNLLRDPSTGDLPWPGLVLGLGIISAWYWCTDQVIVQRCLAGRSLTHVRAGCVVCGYLKVLPMFLMVLPGMAARVLFPDVIGCADPQGCSRACGSALGCSNVAYPRLVLSLLTQILGSGAPGDPGGWFLGGAPGEPRACQPGVLGVVAMVGLSLAWLPVVEAAQKPVEGAFWGLLGGLGLGLARLIPEFLLGSGSCGSPGRCPALLCGLHYLHFAVLLFLLTCAVVLSVSWCHPPIPKVHLHRLVFSLRNSREPRIDLDLEATPGAEPGAGGVASEMGVASAEAPPPEDPKWSRLVDINALVLMGVASFLWGYFA
uniref:Uncharacterized protein n=1 Tax=Geospiza parvula TaxID=87175 RepID=A0A8U8BNI6_GEOPR